MDGVIRNGLRVKREMREDGYNPSVEGVRRYHSVCIYVAIVA